MANKMTKKELVASVKSNLVELTGTKVTNGQAEDALQAVVSAVVEALKSGQNVGLNGFGTFELRERSARTARNPQNGNPIDIPAHIAPAFKPATALKQAVR
jgi:DNA-binding protein HU-beta